MWLFCVFIYTINYSGEYLPTVERMWIFFNKFGQHFPSCDNLNLATTTTILLPD
jgi:hypothetical protein